MMAASTVCMAADVVWFDGVKPVTYEVVGKADPVVTMALQMFSSDMQMVTGMKPVPTTVM